MDLSLSKVGGVYPTGAPSPLARADLPRSSEILRRANSRVPACLRHFHLSLSAARPSLSLSLYLRAY